MRDPAGGQFERERHAVQTAADACHRQCGRRVKPKSWRCAPRTFQEQLDRLPAGQAGRIGGKVQIWQLKGRNSPDHLAGQAKRLAARDEHGQARTAFQQRHDQVGARPEQVLAVVQQHHHRPVSELVHQGRRGRPGTGQRQAQRRRGRRRHQPPVPDAGQLNEPYAVRGRIGTREAACGLDPQPGLADPAGPGQREQPGALGERQQLGEFPAPPDEAGRRRREVGDSRRSGGSLPGQDPPVEAPRGWLGNRRILLLKHPAQPLVGVQRIPPPPGPIECLHQNPVQWLVTLALPGQRPEQRDRILGIPALHEGPAQPQHNRVMQTGQPLTMGCGPARVAVLRQQLTGIEAARSPVIFDIAGTQCPLRRHGEHLVVDAEVFTVAAQRALRSGNVEDYRAARGLYTGELLPEDRDAGWAASHRQRLAGLHDAIVLGLGRALMERGNAEDAVTLLGTLAWERQSDEPLHRVLMEALDRAGRRWDALDAYERLRRVLEEEYAAVPEPSTRSLYRRILSGQAPAGPAAVSNLPAPATSFVGRRRELSELLALAERTRLLTLAGPGGIGKTRLGIETARRLASPDAAPDGVWLVELSGVRDGRLVPAAAAASLGLALTGARPTTAALVNQLADRTMVVLLDNCEHLLGACADLVMALLERCPGLTVLITSREPLRLPGEVVWRVPSLELPDLDLAADPARLAGRESVQLFLERARSASPAFRLDASTALPVARICCRLDGMPLALELAACRVAHLAPAELAARLDDALVTLAGRIRGVPDRQATLAATLDWSHDLLADIERAAFRRLSVFAGGLTLDAAEAVCGDGLSEPVATVIWRLVDKSLVAADTAGDQARFRLLEVVRQYAAARLDSSGELSERQRRHALWFAGRAESLDPDVGGGLVGEPSPWFGVEGGNLRVALWTLLREMPDRALVTAVAMWRSRMARGLHAEGLRWLTQALDACPAASPLRARR